MSEDALRKTWEHIDLVQKLLMSAQIELMKRQVTHDRSKLSSPEWEMFAEITHKLEGLTYGSEEYEAQRKEMLGKALGHHYEHNRHHPEFFDQRALLPSDDNYREYIDLIEWVENGGLVIDVRDLENFRLIKELFHSCCREQMSSVNNMNLFDILEMLIDWTAACKRHADGDINKSIEINTTRFNLSPQLVNIMKNTVPYLTNEFEELLTQKDLYKNPQQNE